MPAHSSLADIAAEIGGRRLPALFLDTCSTLDVIRCAARGQPRIAAIVRQVIEARAAGELFLYGPSVLLKEAARNRVEVASDASKKARAIDQSMTAHQRVAAIIGANYPHTTPYSHESLIAPLIDLHDQLLAACDHIVSDGSLTVAAFSRASDNRRPARKGGGANDCLLFEEFRSIAFAGPDVDPLVLLTTNLDDFGDKALPGGVHQEIANDLMGTRASVCLSWDLAASLVLGRVRLNSI